MSPGFSPMRLWNDKEARSVIIQILTMALLVAFLAYIVTNAIANLEAIGKTFSFGFLNQPASYDINQTLIPYTSRSTHLQAAIVGLLNTLLVAVCGIVLATLLGFLLGVLRLSSNWLVNRMAYCFIEFTRNVPVLLHILLIHGIIVTSLPRPKSAIDLGGTFFLSNRGFFVPSPQFEPAFWAVFIAFLVAVAFAIGFSKHAHKVQDQTGKHLPVVWVNLGAIICLPLIVYFIAGMPLTWQIPELKGFNYAGGLVLRPEFLALWLALSYYTSSFIAEIVRAGIIAVSYGQTEAAYALGLRPNRTLSLIIIPQALRVIVPPLASQYMNLMKNSSLAIAIGYMDLVATIGGISLMQTGKEMETMIIVLLTYLFLSLSISAVMNWYNRRIKLVER
jgi:general L-amino acid transport system permease protein